MQAVVAAATPRRLAHLTLSDDPFVHRLTPALAREAVEAGLTAGRAAAEMAAVRWRRDPEGIAAALNVPITRSHAPAQTGHAVLFSEYGDRPPVIVLHMQSIAEANRLICEHDLGRLLCVRDVEPLHLAHEIYHHLESQRLTPGTLAFRISSCRVGPFRFRTALPSLSEIAANQFAAILLGLAVPPRAIEFVTVYRLNAAYAWDLLQRLEALPT
ncbi:MAG TPA: hypothetical protein VMG58_10715 [Candidatus Sulfotelmatobacter sp.]|nr:hypothetical protein [Candidatus Sulfotelmatobacter sp.]